MVDYGGDKKVAPPGPSLGSIVGQDELVRALQVVAANDDLGGLLVRGAKGTAKSTAVRGLPAVLPEQTAVADCPYGCPPDDPGAQCPDCRDRADLPIEKRPVPLVTLPLGATRDRLVGSLSVADALDGDYEFEPGLLARANRGILYVDEVNLLSDHLVDLLLDAAASGRNRVERDGVSVTHPAAFTLVGTMNPEEGDLRPQLRDRFDLQVSVEGCAEPERRKEIVRRSLGDAETASGDGGADVDGRDPETAAIAERLAAARDYLDEVTLPEDRLDRIVTLCRDVGVEGHRGDIATARAARTLAALDRRPVVTGDDVRTAAHLALGHRMTARPFEDGPDVEDALDEHFEAGEDTEARGDDSGAGDDGTPDEQGGSDDGAAGDEDAESGGDSDAEQGDRGPGGGGRRPGSADAAGGGSPDTGAEDGDADGDDGARGPEPDESTDPGPGGDGDRTDDSARAGAAPAGGDSEAGERGDGPSPATDDPDENAETPAPRPPGGETAAIGAADAPAVPDASEAVEGATTSSAGSGRTTSAERGADGPRVRTRRANEGDAVDVSASVRAAATAGRAGVTDRDLRASVRETEATALVTFVVDASASMRPAMRAAKGTVMTLLQDAYEGRDAVAVVAFAGEDAEVLLPPTDSVTLAARHLKELPTGDRTPLPAGLSTAADVVGRADPAHSVVVLVTDGRANVATGGPTAATRAAAERLAATDSTVIVVDAGEDGRAGVLDVVAEATDGQRLPLSELSAERVDAAVDSATR